MTFANDPETWVRVATFLPIVICSVVGFGLTLAKWLDLREPNVPPGPELADIRTAFREGDHPTAVAIAGSDRSRRRGSLNSWPRRPPGHARAFRREPIG